MGGHSCESRQPEDPIERNQSLEKYKQNNPTWPILNEKDSI